MATLPEETSRFESELSPPASDAGATLRGTFSADNSRSLVRRSVLYWFSLRARVRGLAEERPLPFVAGIAILAFSLGIVLRATVGSRHE